MRSIGVDLGWTSGASGLALFDVRGEQLRCVESARLRAIDEVLRWIEARAGEDCVVAVDAPLRIANCSGMREAEKVAHRLYGKYDAGCYPANLASPFAARTTGFSRALSDLGFEHSHEPFANGRRQFECFPHIAAVEFFDLDRILKYKKGPRAARFRELSRLRELICERLPVAGLREILPTPPASGDLKPAEDQLDAALCAYAGYWWWRWGLERNRVLGDPLEGCMITPYCINR